MERLHLIIAGLTAVILFIYGLESFSQEIQRVSGERFRRFVGQATRLPVIGVLIGALVTAVIQSSSATSVIAIGLVNAGVLSFKNSVGVIFGSNVGTTITAQLVAFKLTAFAPVFIIVGFLLSVLRTRLSVFGKTLFFFGFVFFSLNLISSSLAPLQNDPAFTAWLTQPQNPLLAILVVFCIPVAILNGIVGIDTFLYYAMIPSAAVWLMVLVTCEMLVVIGLFQWWYYQPPSERVQIPDEQPEPAQETTGVVQETAAVVAARRACLAAVLGMAFCPPLLNFYSLWLIRKHKLYAGELPGREKGLVYTAIVINALVCLAVLLLVLLTGGLSLR